jgi:hypothetical protein
MQFNKKNKVRKLLEKYFEGQTSADEEKFLRRYFAKNSDNGEFAAERAMFRYFGSEAAAKKTARIVPIPWWIAAAASVLLILGLHFFTNTQKTVGEQSLAWIDGKQYSDVRIIATETVVGLNNLSDSGDGVIEAQIEAIEFLIEN